MHFFLRKNKNKTNQNKVLAALFFVLLLAIIINLFLFNANFASRKDAIDEKENRSGVAAESKTEQFSDYDNYILEKRANLSKSEEDLDQKINMIMDDCDITNQQTIIGVVENIEAMNIYVLPPESVNSKKIELTPKTVYFEISASGMLPKKEITYYDLSVGDSVFVMRAMIKNESGGQEPAAIYIKKILLDQ